MTKNELIEKLQSVEGNPKILLNDAELGCSLLKTARLEKMHKAKNNIDGYIPDFSFQSEIGLNTFYHENYNEEIEECIVLDLE